MGDVTADLSGRRAQVNGMRAGLDGWTVVSALAPLAELSGYQSRLHSATGGSGSYTLSFSHYEAAPMAMQQKMAAQYSAAADEE
jgi:elongation factor G